jgi:septum formation protein
LLRAAGFEFDVVTAGVDESLRAGESPDAYVRRLAEAKAREVAQRHRDRPVLGADTVVVCGAAILGKPVDAGDARRMLRMLSGRRHVVMTGVCLHHAGSCRGVVAETTVEFATLTDAEIDWYVASGEPSDKAGAYAIQGLASRFVTSIQGSYSNVVGLPVSLVYDLCTQAGILIS